MLPLVNNISTPIPIQPTLVSTPLPENQTLRTPHDNVPPPVSNVQIHNNARGNSGGFFAAPEAAPAVAPPVDAEILPVSVSRINGANGFGAPATFLAQLLSQDVPAEAQIALRGVLVEYEKLIARPYVKYKPSNATLPEPIPSGVFGKLVLEQKSVPRIQVQTQPLIRSEPAVSTAVAARLPANLNIPTPRPAAARPAQSAASSLPKREFTFAAPAVTPAPVAIKAYSTVQNNLPQIIGTESVQETDVAAKEGLRILLT